MPREYEIRPNEMLEILEYGNKHGYFKFKERSAGEGLRYLILAVEGVLLKREHERLQIKYNELQMEIRGKEIRKLG